MTPSYPAIDGNRMTDPSPESYTELELKLEACAAELAEEHAYRIAIGDVLQIIGESPGDLQPVLDTITQRAMTLCDAHMGAVTSFDGEQIQLMAYHGVSLEEEQATRALFPMSPGLGMMLARAIADHAPAQSTDVSNDPEHVSREASPRNVLAVPMLTGATCIGSIAVSRSEPGLFSDKQVKLLQTFADQEVIAIENARLFAEIEALVQQTVTAEILQVISDSPSDVQPVFQAIADRAMTMCKALSA